MNDRVYLETSFIGYLTSRPNRDLIVAGHQQLTHEWWEDQRQHFELCISQLVLQEAGSGDPDAAQERLDVLKGIQVLDITQDAINLAQELLSHGALPEKAGNDALHIAIAAVQHIPYLLTWNCKHIANATMRPVIQLVCEQRGLRMPILCTPDELRKVVKP